MKWIAFLFEFKFNAPVMGLMNVLDGKYLDESHWFSFAALKNYNLLNNLFDYFLNKLLCYNKINIKTIIVLHRWHFITVQYIYKDSL